MIQIRISRCGQPAAGPKPAPRPTSSSPSSTATLRRSPKRGDRRAATSRGSTTTLRRKHTKRGTEGRPRPRRETSRITNKKKKRNTSPGGARQWCPAILVPTRVHRPVDQVGCGGSLARGERRVVTGALKAGRGITHGLHIDHRWHRPDPIAEKDGMVRSCARNEGMERRVGDWPRERSHKKKSI